MKILLIVLTITIAGCASGPELPEVGTGFADYELSEFTAVEKIAAEPPEIAGQCLLDGVSHACITIEALADIRALTIANDSNGEAVERLSDALAAKHRELELLVMAGRQVEQLAELYRALYLHEASSARAQALLMSTGALGALLLAVGFAL